MPDIIRVYDSPSLPFPFSLSLSSHAAEEEGETDRVDGGGGMRGGDMGEKDGWKNRIYHTGV